MAENAIRGVHAGASGDAQSLFSKGYAGIGREQVGDLSVIPGTRDAFKKRYSEVFPDARPQSVATSAGVLFRSVHEMKPDDVVVWRSKTDNIIHIGTVSGGYQYDPVLCAPYPNQRSVQWGKVAPIRQFTQGALYELGSALSLFQPWNYGDEFISALTGGERGQGAGAPCRGWHGPHRRHHASSRP